jgi:hypothetical protein
VFLFVNFEFNSVSHLVQAYKSLCSENTSFTGQTAAEAAQEAAEASVAAPVYNQPTPSPRKRIQETLTQNDWGARPIPAGWNEHKDKNGCVFYYNRRTQQWAPTYEHMFMKPTPRSEEILTQKSPPTSQESRVSLDSKQAKKRHKHRQNEPEDEQEVGTQMLPGSEYMIPFVDDDNSSQAADEKSQLSDDSQTVW